MFGAEVRKRGKTKFWVEIPDEVRKSLDLKEGQFVKVALRRVEKKSGPTKPRLTASEACNRLAPSEGQRENKWLGR